MNTKIVVATDLTDEAIEALKAQKDIDIVSVAPRLRAVQEALADAHALIARDDIPVDKALVDGAPLLKVVRRVGAGLAGIDIPAASARGIIGSVTRSRTAAFHSHWVRSFASASTRGSNRFESTSSILPDTPMPLSPTTCALRRCGRRTPPT